MPVVGNSFITMRDLSNGLKRDGSLDTDLIDMISENNPILDDIPVVECNDGSSHTTTLRTQIPSAIFRAYFQGTPSSKGAVAQIKASTGQLSSLLQAEKTMLDKDPNKDAYLRREVNGHMQAMGESYAESLFYGSTKTEARGFDGLDGFFNAYGSDTLTDDKNPAFTVFNGGSTTLSQSALRSIWLVDWSPDTIFSIYPQGAKSGLWKGELKSTTAKDAAGNDYEIYQQFFYWDVGLCVRDYRHAGRIANIEADKLFLTESAGRANIIETLRRLTTRVRAGGKRVLYMDKLVWEGIGVAFARATAQNAITYGNLEERKPDTLFGIPVRVCDCLNTNETAVAQAQ